MRIVKLAVMPEKLVVKLVAPTEMLVERLVAPTEMLVERLVVSPGRHSGILLDKYLVVLEALQRPLCVRFSPELASGHLKSPVEGWTSFFDVVIDPCGG